MIDKVTLTKTIARSFADSPDIDGQVIIHEKISAKPGDIMKVMITDADEYDLWGIKT